MRSLTVLFPFRFFIVSFRSVFSPFQSLVGNHQSFSTCMREGAVALVFFLTRCFLKRGSYEKQRIFRYYSRAASIAMSLQSACLLAKLEQPRGGMGWGRSSKVSADIRDSWITNADIKAAACHLHDHRYSPLRSLLTPIGYCRSLAIAASWSLRTILCDAYLIG